MRKVIIYNLCVIVLMILGITQVTMAEPSGSSDEGNAIYELQVVYPAPLVYMSDFGVGMQGKYYQKPGFYLGWYIPVRMVFPTEQKQMWNSFDSISSDIQVKLMGTVGYTMEKRYFTFDTCFLAGCRYWYLKTTVQNPAYSINGSYESSTTSFEAGLMTTVRWKLGESLKLNNSLSRVNMDFYAYWPITGDLFESEARSELALGFSYGF